MPGGWLIIILAAALPAAAGASILIVVCLVCNNAQSRRGGGRPKKKGISALWPSKDDRLEGSITKRIKANQGANHNKEQVDASVKYSSKIANAWRAAYPIKDFSWNDHPGLVAEAVEHGWSTFAFTFAHLDTPIPPKLWESCARLSFLPPSPSLGAQPELSWEVNGASSDYMQKLRLHPAATATSKKDHGLFNGLIGFVQTLQTTLPLPGPPLGPLSFPQEGYYEITVFGMDSDLQSFAELSHSSITDEHAQLIAPSRRASHALQNGYASSDTPHDIEPVNKRPSSFGISININDNISKSSAAMENGEIVPQVAHQKEEVIDGPALQSAAIEQQICSIGLAAGSAPPFRFPGSDAASIGFFSNGRVFLNGKEQKKPEGWRGRVWGPTAAMSTPTIVGCGFDPAARRLFFTLNGEMVEEIKLPPMNANGAAVQRDAAAGSTSSNKSMEFTAYPLFPTIGANYCVTITANFGQAAFAYGAANAQRVPNPCFRRPPAASGSGKAAGEDSGDLFSMGRIDSRWLEGLGGGVSAAAALGAFGSPVHRNASFRKSSAVGAAAASSSLEPANRTPEVVESDLFEITLDSRTLK